MVEPCRTTASSLKFLLFSMKRNGSTNLKVRRWENDSSVFSQAFRSPGAGLNIGRIAAMVMSPPWVKLRRTSSSAPSTITCCSPDKDKSTTRSARKGRNRWLVELRLVERLSCIELRTTSTRSIWTIRERMQRIGHAIFSPIVLNERKVFFLTAQIIFLTLLYSLFLLNSCSRTAHVCISSKDREAFAFVSGDKRATLAAAPAQTCVRLFLWFSCRTSSLSSRNSQLKLPDALY